MADAQPADPMNEALDREAPEAWMPKKAGDQIVGVLARVENRTTKFGPSSAMILVDEDGREWAVWLFYESLKTGLDRLRPAAGEKVGVRYLGQRDAKNPTPGRAAKYHDFKVVVDRPIQSQQVDWGAALTQTAEVPEGEEAPF